jgi:hypothetical protein
MLVAIAMPMAVAVHNGGTGLEDSDVAGCHCHNLAPDPGVTLNLMGVPERYEPDQVYELIVTVAGGPPIVEGGLNVGGFMLSCSNGTLAVPEGSDQVQVFNDGQAVSHTMAGNDYRQWSVLWKAPKEGTGDAVFWLSANTVNGDGVETGELDAYNQLLSISFGEPVTAAPEEGVSEWGVPLRAYWMGTIAFVATLVLTWAAYYLIKGTSRHSLVHIGRRRRYVVETRDPPSSYGAAFTVGVLVVIEVIAGLVLGAELMEGGTDVGIAVNLAVVLALFLAIVAIYRSAFVPRLTRLEADRTPPGGGEVP